MSTCRRPSGRLARDESGAALLEFSLVFGIFVFILYGLIAFGSMLALKQSITSAAAEAARSTVGMTDDTAAEAAALAVVTDRLDWLGAKYDPGDVTADVAACPAPTSGRCITVTITYPYSTRPLVPPAPGLGLLTPDTFGSTAVVQISL
jgi:Flp pilus assembly protein TadG